VSRLRGRAVQRASHDSKEFGTFCFGAGSCGYEVERNVGRVANSGRARWLRSPRLLYEMQPVAVVFLHIFDRENFATKARELGEFLLDRQ
jgi:hypothetical protein